MPPVNELKMIILILKYAEITFCSEIRRWVVNPLMSIEKIIAFSIDEPYADVIRPRIDHLIAGITFIVCFWGYIIFVCQWIIFCRPWRIHNEHLTANAQLNCYCKIFLVMIIYRMKYKYKYKYFPVRGDINFDEKSPGENLKYPHYCLRLKVFWWTEIYVMSN